MTSPVVERDARDDILAIWNYLANDSVAAADRWLTSLQATIVAIGEHPGMGHRRPEITARPLRFLTSRGTTVVYRDDVVPVRIIHVAGRGRSLGALVE